MGAQPVVVVTRPTSQVLSELAAGEGQLTVAERKRCARLRQPQDRADFLAARVLVRRCAAQLLGVAAHDIVIVQRCATCGGPHGRPEVAGHPEVAVSLAHSAAVVAAAAGTVPVGVDVEVIPPAGGPGLTPEELSIVLTPSEVAAIRAATDACRALRVTWSRKEACLKAGLVDLDGFGQYDLSGLPLDPLTAELVLRPVTTGSWTLHDWWDGRVGAVGAVAAPTGADLTFSG